MARKSMNILDIVAWINANRSELIGSRLENFYRYEDLFLAKISSGGRDLIIVLEPGVRIHSTRRLKPSGKYKPFPLVVLARKHLRGARISDLSLLGFDRIIKFKFSNGFSMIIELIPRGFITLLDPNDTIYAADRYEVLRDRVVKPKIKYRPPPLNLENAFMLEKHALMNMIKQGKDLIRGLIRGAKLPGEVAEEVLYRSQLDPSSDPSSLPESSMDSLLHALDGIWRESMNGKGYIVYRREDERGTPIEVDPFKPLRFNDNADIIEYDYLDYAYDDFFYYKKVAGGDHREESEMQKLMASLKEAEETERKYREKAEELRKTASLLAERFQWLEYVISCVRNSISLHRDPIDCEGVIGLERGKFKLSVDNTTITISTEENADQVIVRLFREAGELEAKAKRASKAREQIMARLGDAEVKARARRLAARVKARKRYWFERYHWIITRNSLLAIGGRDASQNESVVRRYLSENDIFIHADIHGAPAVVVITRGIEPDVNDIIDASTIAVAYSKAWKSGIGSLGAYWVWGSQVSKSPPSGEYLAKGGFIIRGKKNYLKPIRVSISIGIALDEEELPLIIIGPDNLVEGRSIAYATLEPGDMKLEDTVKTLKNMFHRVLPEESRHIPLAIPDEEIALRVPGRSRIVKVKKGKGERLNIAFKNL